MLFQVALIVPVDNKVLLVDDSDHFTGAGSEIDRENKVGLSQLKVKLNELAIEHHLEYFLRLILVINCNYVEVVDCSWVLERFLHRLVVNLLLSHWSVIDFNPLPFTLKVEVTRLKYLN